MAQRTLLDMTQRILDSLGEDQVDSIEDTTNSLKVANIIRDTYYSVLANRNWAHREVVTTLSPYGLGKPTHLNLNSRIKEIGLINYNKAKAADTRTRYMEVSYKPPEDFLDMVNSRNLDNDNIVEVEDVNGVKLLIKNDTAPRYWTSFDQQYVIFDSYDTEVDDTIQESKLQVHGFLSSEFTLDDTFVPNMPEEAFPFLLSEAKSVAFIEIAQDVNQKAEQEARRQNTWLSRKSRVAGDGYKLVRKGRVSRKTSR